MVEPHKSTLAGIYLYRQRNKAEQGAHSKEADTEQQDAGKALDAQDTDEQYPRHILGGERDYGHERRTHLQGTVCLGMLHGMATLVGRHSGCSHTAR